MNEYGVALAAPAAGVQAVETKNYITVPKNRQTVLKEFHTPSRRRIRLVRLCVVVA